MSAVSMWTTRTTDYYQGHNNLAYSINATRTPNADCEWHKDPCPLSVLEPQEPLPTVSECHYQNKQNFHEPSESRTQVPLPISIRNTTTLVYIYSVKKFMDPRNSWSPSVGSACSPQEVLLLKIKCRCHCFHLLLSFNLGLLTDIHCLTFNAVYKPASEES